MGDGTAIEWTDATWNPLVGCSRTSPGCDHCYAIGVAHRGMAPQHVGLTVKPEGERVDWTGEVRFVPDMLNRPLRWKRPRRIFVNSMSDLFHSEVDDLTIARIFAVMALAPRHTFQVLTKRSKAMAGLLADPEFVYKVGLERRQLVNEHGLPHDVGLGWPLPNVWLGVSIESDRYTFRADHLRATPAAVRWISAEPLLGPLPSLNLDGIDWVVAGGESGPGARPMHPDWVRDLRDRCVDRGTAYLFKQWGSWGVPANHGPTYSLYDETEVGTIIPYKRTSASTVTRVGLGDCDYVQAVIDTGHSQRLVRMGKSDAGRELDGRTWDEYPDV